MNEQKVAILIEALPYIKEFWENLCYQIWGSIMSNEKAKAPLLRMLPY